MLDDGDRCYRAVRDRDARFDGWFVAGVTSSGIYGRPSCPSRTPRREHVRFYESAAAAQQAGFRACRRCRPDAAPGSPEWDRRGDLAGRAMRLIGDGLVDRVGVAGLAAQLGRDEPAVERALIAETGTGGAALARARRAEVARVLLAATMLPVAQVADAAGFAGARQLSETVGAVFGMGPTEVRRRAGHTTPGPPGPPDPPGPRGRPDAPAGSRGGAAMPAVLSIRLPFRRPLNPTNLFGHLVATAVPGVEEVRGGAYRRSLRLPRGAGIAELTPHADHVACRLALTDVRDVAPAIARCRWVLDLDADPEGVDAHLARDPVLAPLVARAPGRRIPRSADGSEMALRAVIGQQISTAAARTQAVRLTAAHGTPVSDPRGSITHLFPTPAALAGVRLAGPQRRADSFAALVAALADGRLCVDPGADREAARAALDRLPGIGPWTAEMVAMRALGDPDAFPASDLGVRRAAQALGLPVSPRGLNERTRSWSPWRAYAVQYLWSLADHPINDWPPRVVR
ncbi:MAG TPA: AlkA N-terminal domain-containing protein [Solirubrobacteraceae bacterium]|jgi:AraC family transcriptional regulator of adaptative response / DNA-3-methyladenine glycosylase II|nr:AlkA N-terminal domain-containing protein [Solirubrobacteraceae bacterium]